jgi:hypothetical protein
MSEIDKKVITLNDKVITEEELQRKIEESKKTVGIKIEEVTPNNYRQRIQG